MKNWLIIIFAICLTCCGGGGSDSGGGGFGGENEPLTLPAIIAQGDADYYLLRIDGTLEKIESPLEYYLDGFLMGEYFFQVLFFHHEDHHANPVFFFY